MAIFDKLRARFKSALSSDWAGYRRSADYFFSAWPSQNCIVPNPTGCGEMISSLVESATNFLGTVLSGSPVEVYSRDGDEWSIIHDHPMSMLLAEPNPYHSGALFWKTFAYYWLVDGNVFLYKSRNQSGQVVELWLLQSERVTVRSQPGEFISFYEYSPPGGGSLEQIDVEDIVHFRFKLNPTDHRLGISPLVSVSAEIATDIQGEMYSRQALANFGVPPYILSPKMQGDNYVKFDVADVAASIELRSSGANRGKPIVLSKPAEFKEFGYSPQQMDTKVLRRVPEERVSAVTGIPAIVLGYGVGLEHATYANYRTALRAAWDNCVIPTQRQIAADLWKHLLPDFEQPTTNFWVEFDNDDVDALKENVNDEFAREIAAYVNGVKKRSEVRTEFDLDVTPDDEVYLIEPGSQTPATPSGMGEATRSTMRQPRVPTIEPGAPVKQFGIASDGEPTGADLDRLEAYFREVMPSDAWPAFYAKTTS